MLFCLTFIYSFLLASAVPVDHLHEYRQLGILDRAELSTDSASNGFQTSQFFAGAVLDGGNQNITCVTGSFIIPSIGSEKFTYATAWVGIDDTLCGSGPLAAGISFGTGPPNSVWYAWQDETLNPISDFPIDAGYNISFSLVGYGSHSSIVIRNVDTGHTWNQKFDSHREFCGRKARWGVKGFMDDIPEFGTVTFTDVSVNRLESASDMTVTAQLDEATLFNMVRSEGTVAVARTDGVSSVIVERT